MEMQAEIEWAALVTQRGVEQTLVEGSAETGLSSLELRLSPFDRDQVDERTTRTTTKASES